MLDITYLTIFISFFAILLLAMKGIALKSAGSLPSNFSKTSFLFKTPLIAVKTTRLSGQIDNQTLHYLMSRMLKFSIAFFGMYWMFNQLFTQFHFPDIGKSYLLPFFIYIITGYICVCTQILCLPTGKIPIDMHNHPLLAKNLREFWGFRWNIWVRDWLNVVTKKFYSKKSIEKKAFTSFLISGIFHELMFQVPYGIYSGNWIIGPMIMYFLIQWIGVVLDFKIKANASNRMRRFLMWTFLILPSPLFINKAVLYFLGF